MIPSPSSPRSLPDTRTASPADTPRAVLYVRISSDPFGMERGVESQEEDCRQYAVSQGWSVVHVFSENDTSAFKQKTLTLPSGERIRRVVRPAYRAMLQLLARGEADVLVTYDLDRAVRDPRDLEDLIEAKVLHGFSVRSLTQSLRLDTDSDVAMARVMVAMANKSSADTARRVKRSAARRAKRGEWHGGAAPFGYRLSGGVIHVVPAQAALIRDAVDHILSGRSMYSVVKRWNDTGVLSPKGGVWFTNVLRNMLRNPALAGWRSHRPTGADGTPSATATLTRGAWEPILDQETWDKLQHVLDVRAMARAIPGHSTKRVHPFSGLIFCGRCGMAMASKGDGYACRGSVSGHCSRKINSHAVTEYIESAVLQVFRRPDITDLLALSGEGEEMRPYREQLADDRAALADADDDYYDGLLDKEGWFRQRSRLLERIERNQRFCNTFDVTVTLQGGSPALIAQQWGFAGPIWQYDAARLLIDRVVIHPHPDGISRRAVRRAQESDDAYHDRRARYAAEIVRRRAEILWLPGIKAIADTVRDEA